MKKYIILRDTFLHLLEKLINESIEDGYIPHGPLIAYGQYNSSFAQPMILDAKNEGGGADMFRFEDLKGVDFE